jgi:hypothetical protein
MAEEHRDGRNLIGAEAPVVFVGESDTCVVEFECHLRLEPQYGPRPRSSPRSGTRVEAPTDRLVGQYRGPGQPRESHGPRGRLFDPHMVLGHPECQ